MNKVKIRPGFVFWLTGLPASGKTSLAYAIRDELYGYGIKCAVLDSDKLRQILTPKASYRQRERDWFYETVARMAAYLAEDGVNIIIAAVGNHRSYRDLARQLAPRFAEIYLDCSLETCQSRDPKGIYARAARSKSNTVPGLGAVYEPPLYPEVTINTVHYLPREAAGLVLAQLEPMWRPIPSNGSQPPKSLR